VTTFRAERGSKLPVPLRLKVRSGERTLAQATAVADRYSHLFDHAYSDVSDELERAWTATETAAETMTTAVVSR